MKMIGDKNSTASCTAFPSLWGGKNHKILKLLSLSVKSWVRLGFVLMVQISFQELNVGQCNVLWSDGNGLFVCVLYIFGYTRAYREKFF